MKTTTSLISLAAVAIALAGCDSNKNVGYKHITSHLTPELHGLAERKVDDHNARTVASNQDLRMFWDDIGRALYCDTPSRLSPYPILNTSGQPH